MSAGKIRNELKANHGIEDPQVVSFERRRNYYVVEFEADDLPEIDGYSPITDPSIVQL